MIFIFFFRSSGNKPWTNPTSVPRTMEMNTIIGSKQPFVFTFSVLKPFSHRSFFGMPYYNLWKSVLKLGQALNDLKFDNYEKEDTGFLDLP